MQIPTRKPGQYSGQKQDAHMSRAKYEELKEQLERLKRFSRPQAAKEMKLHAQDGDFSENAAYQTAKARLRGVNSRIDRIDDLLKRAVVIKEAVDSDRVRIGSQVNVEVNGREKTFRILGPAEADPKNGIISHLSPLGRALLGQKAGDEVELETGERTAVYKILRIL